MSLPQSPLLPFTYSQTPKYIKIQYQFPDQYKSLKEDDIDVQISETRVVVTVDEDDSTLFDVSLFSQASQITSEFKVKNECLVLKLFKQHEGASWGPIFANGFDYSVPQEFPSAADDFDPSDLQEVQSADIVLKEQAPPMQNELDPVKDKILSLLAVYENMRREWLKEHLEDIKEARERGLSEMKEADDADDDLDEYARNLWEEAREAFVEVLKDPEALKETFEKAKRAAEYGCSDAQHFVADAYAADGSYYGVEKDKDLANAFFKRAAFQSEHSEAFLPLVAIEEEAAKEDKSRLSVAKALYLKAAQLGNPTAFFKLGVLLHNEYEEEKDKELVNEAIEWWKLALRRGHAPAARNIGSTLKDDLSDKERALQYFQLGSQWSDQIHVPSDLKADPNDPDSLLDDVANSMFSQKREESPSPSSESTNGAQTSAKESSPPRPNVRSTTPTTQQTDDIMAKLERTPSRNSRVTPKRPYSDALSPSPVSNNSMRRGAMPEEEEEEEEEVREAGLLWKASAWLTAVSVTGGAAYLAMKAFGPPRNAQQAQGMRSTMPVPGLSL